jgi:hypothetical protein
MTTPTTEKPVYGPAPVANGTGGPRGGLPTAEAPADEVTTRFLQFLIPAAATVASTFGPQIGSAIGGLFGGSGAQAGSQIGGSIGGVLGNLGGGVNLGGLFGGRSFLPPGIFDQWNPSDQGIVQQPVDLTGPLVHQCTLECLGKITPGLAAQLNDMYPQMAPADEDSRSAEAANAEIEAVERFWPQIASFLTEQVANNLPDIIKTVTSSVMPLLGTRDAAQFTPMLTGTEANARWFLPVLSTVLTTVQQTLPNLLSVLGGAPGGRPRDTGITWTDLETYGRFWDNDFIRVVGQEEIANKNNVELVLELAPHLSWAKQIQVRDDNGTVITRLHVQDATKWAEASVPADQILTNGSLLFAKAKMFGIMTGMYYLPTAGVDQLKGQRTHIRWMAD